MVNFIISYFKRKPLVLILLFILLIGLFFRTYKVVERFEFAHDGDLYSWIVKDIVINHHPRLIGQLTSAPGVFIGPLFYYLLVPFFILTNMDPIGALIPATILGILTIISYYFVISKLFNKKAALIIAFLYAVLLSTVNFDRWVVPTIPTSIWAVWYLYTILMLGRGKFFVLPLLGVLIGLIWHIHIALIPTLIAFPIAILSSKKLPSLKQATIFLIALLITSLPFIFFEIKHNFTQTLSVINNLFIQQPGVPRGIEKFQHVLEMVSKNLNALLFAPQSYNFTNNLYFIIVILLSGLILVKKKLLSFKELLIIYSWIIGVILFFSLSSSPISEYYFANMTVLFLVITGLLLYLLFQSSRIGKLIVLLILSLILVKNAYFITTQGYYNKGYLERKSIVEMITSDAKARGFNCFGVSYITGPGENVGFRYFFWLKKTHLVRPSLDVAVYNIVIPDELSWEVEKKSGHIGLILPKKIPPQETFDKSCQTPDTNLSDSVFGYVD